MDGYNDLKKAEKAAFLSIFAYLFLAVLKIVAGQLGNSDALLADGLNNTTDIVASVALLIGLRISRIPPDADHSYGHRRTETISSLIASIIMFLVGVQVIWSSIVHIIEKEFATPSMLTAVVALFLVYLCMLFIYIIISLRKNLIARQCKLLHMIIVRMPLLVLVHLSGLSARFLVFLGLTP